MHSWWYTCVHPSQHTTLPPLPHARHSSSCCIACHTSGHIERVTGQPGFQAGCCTLQPTSMLLQLLPFTYDSIHPLLSQEVCMQWRGAAARTSSCSASAVGAGAAAPRVRLGGGASSAPAASSSSSSESSSTVPCRLLRESPAVMPRLVSRANISETRNDASFEGEHEHQQTKRPNGLSIEPVAARSLSALNRAPVEEIEL